MILKQGDTIGIIALSGDCEKEKVEKAQTYFEGLGYRVRLSENIYEQNRYLAGTDEKKVDELHDFFEDSDIKLILCARGGYGGIRLINKINYRLIKEHPKPFCGFSDVTSLLIMINRNSGIVTYHSPMACSDFGSDEVNEVTKSNFFNAISDKPLSFEGDKVFRNGFAQGVLIGGNLATVASLCGQNFIPDENFIFFTEDLNEPVYKIDKMFQQLLNIKKFAKNCKGIILGDFLGVDNEEWLEDYFKELGLRLGIPMIGGYKITHSCEKITLPIGKFAQLNEKKLIIS